MRRFVQLLGIYPPGTLVKLASDAVAVVTRVHAPDPYRPRVKVLFAPDGARYDAPLERNLWERAPDGRRSTASSRRSTRRCTGSIRSNFLDVARA